MRRRLFIITLLLVSYGAVLFLAWTFGPSLFDLPVMTGFWVMVIGLGILLGVPCGIFRIQDLRRFRKQYQMAHGLCLTCGYDLRASKDRCPECGTPISPALGKR